MISLPTKEELKSAAALVGPFVHKTPVLTSRFLNKITGAEIFFKCENFQRMGAFKMRGATYAVLNLSEEDKKKGVATHSSGNFAQALALSAQMHGIKAYIVMPSSANKKKRDAVIGYGGEVFDCQPTLAARESKLEEIVATTEATFIHPYDNINVILGNSTCAQELIAEVPGLEIITAPVGGGGLMAGTALAAHYFEPDAILIGSEPSGADDAARSLKAGKIIPSIDPDTIADGLLTSLGIRNFPIIQKLVSEILTSDDDSIINSMRYIWERMKIIVEPSAAVTLATILDHPEKFKNKRVGVILSGGNVDLDQLPFHN